VTAAIPTLVMVVQFDPFAPSAITRTLAQPLTQRSWSSSPR